jgi:hypothetical protein
MKIANCSDNLINLAEPIVQRELMRLKDERKLSEVAKRLRLHNNRLTELLSGQRKLSAYYLSMLIGGRIVEIEQILQGRKLEELAEEDRLFLQRLIVDDETIKLLSEINDPERVKKLLRALKG